MWQDIYSKLREENLNPYAPGQHKGECEKFFAIVMEGTQIPSIQSNMIGQQVIDIILFVPVNSYIAMKPYRDQVVDKLKELKYLRKTGLETPIITDDNKKAYTMSIQYIIMKKLEG